MGNPILDSDKLRSNNIILSSK